MMQNLHTKRRKQIETQIKRERMNKEQAVHAATIAETAKAVRRVMRGQ